MYSIFPFFLLLVGYFICGIIILVITGARKKDVLSCQHKIELIVESSRQKIPPTHFLSFPLYNMEIISRLEEFKSTALEMCTQVINYTSPINLS